MGEVVPPHFEPPMPVRSGARAIPSVEAEENLCRKDLTPGEAELYWQRLKKLLRPEAEAAQEEARHRKGAGQRDGSTESVEPSRSDRETGRKAAKATGYSEDTLKKVEEVRTTADGLAEHLLDEVAQKSAGEPTDGQGRPDQPPGPRGAPGLLTLVGLLDRAGGLGGFDLRARWR